MQITLNLINHDQEEGFEEFMTSNLPVGTRVTVEWNGLFSYAEVAPAAQWAVTTIAHPALRDVRFSHCRDCLALTDQAVTIARATGSTGATCSEGAHSATVTRVLALATAEA